MLESVICILEKQASPVSNINEKAQGGKESRLG
jgi:hypothetical protein